MRTIDLTAPNALDMEALGARMAAHTPRPRLIHLHGPLGAGKTTWVRGLLRGLGYAGPVKSPTFTLVEPYTFPGFTLYHFDLYRVAGPEELEFLGVRDYLQGTNLCVVEWAERGAPLLLAPDIDVIIQPSHMGRSVRLIAFDGQSAGQLGDLR